ARHLMGETVAAAAAPAAPPPSQYRLLGAMTASGKQRGFAILSEQGKPAFPVVEGEEIAPGLKLSRVLPDKVVLARGGREHTLPMANLEPPPAANARSPAPQAPSPTTPTRPAFTLGPEGRRP